MAKAMQLQPHLLELHLHLKPGLAEGKKDDVKKIWATVGLRRFELFRTKEDVATVLRNRMMIGMSWRRFWI